MKQFSITTTLLATLLFGNVAGCASTATQSGAAQYVDDSAITAGVKAAILADPSLKVAEVNVETHQGVVQLSGFVSSADNVATASSVARTVKGVKSVKNDLRLK
jgi:hyperosmotically inducible protein